MKLLRRRNLLPDETLASLLIRLANANCYEPLTILSDHIQAEIKREGLARDKLDYPYHTKTYEHVATMIDISASNLYAATPHKFAQVLTPPSGIVSFVNLANAVSEPLIAPSIASKQLYPAYSGQFCPVCLQLSPYYRLIWTSVAVSACMEHNCLLVNCCHNCGSKVHIRDIATATCSKCKSNLTENSALSLAGDKFGLLSQYIIQSWLLSSTYSEEAVSLPPGQSPRILFRIIDGLQQVIRTQFSSEWSYLHTINNIPFSLTQEKRKYSPYENYCLYATAFKGIINWPSGFYDFLQAYQDQKLTNLSAHGGPKANLGNLYTQWLQDYWQYPAFDFVQKAFEEYFIGAYHLSSSVARSSLCRSNPDVAKELKYINFTEAARITRTTPRLIELLVSAGRLASYTPDDNPKYKYVNRAEVQEICCRWNEGIECSEAAKWLGVTEEMIVKMVDIGLLAAEYAPSDGFPKWIFAKSVLIELLDQASKHVKSLTLVERTEDSQLVDLADASRLVFVVGLDGVYILQQVIKGKLCAYIETRNELCLGTLLFSRTDLQRCIEDVKAENGWISREEVTKILGVKDMTLARWVKVNLLPPIAVCAHVQYFNKSAVNQFIADYITSDDASQILGIGRLTVQKWAHMGRLSETCVSGPNVDGYHAYLFNKKKLVQWRNERLTFGETVKILGISKASLHEWTKKGMIEPLDDMNGKQRWFSRQDVLKLRQDKE